MTDPHKKDPRQNDPRSLEDAAQLPNAPKKLRFVEVLALGAFSTLFSLLARLFRRTTLTSTVSSDHNASSLTEPDVPAQCAKCMQKAIRGDEDGRVLKEEPLSHEQIGAFLVVLAFLIGAAGGVGFLFLYWTGGSNLLLGCTLACFCGGFGLALVFWSHLLTLKREIVEPRESMEPTDAERQGAREEFEMGADQIHRRGLLKWAIAGGTGIFGAIVVSLFRSLGSSPDQSLYSTIWKRGQMLVSMEGKPMRVDALEPGSTAIVFPEGSVGSERAQTVLIRVDKSQLKLPSDRSDWAPNGNLAFSRVCTHAGCPVGMYETTTHLLMCPCHQSTFDVLRGAEPTAGPAARALPQLPLYVDSEGILRAGSGFSDIPGPGFWSMP
jgi:ubiquinol-cytochrome c reductase iron-sulfur subunit